MTKKLRFATIALASAIGCASALSQTTPKANSNKIEVLNPERVSQAAPKSDSAKPAATPAPVSPDPQATTANYGDWVLRCQHVGDTPAGQRLCEVAQTIQVQGGQAPIAQIGVGRLVASDPLRLTLVLPPNISFPSSPRMAIDEKDARPADLTWRRCLPGGCFADIEIKDDLLQHWRSQSAQGMIRFKDGAGRDVVLPFSFRGFAQALDALAKS